VGCEWENRCEFESSADIAVCSSVRYSFFAKSLGVSPTEILLGDLEFCSIKLANWLREQELMFCLRLKKNEFIEIEDDVWQELNDLGLKPGVSFFIEGIKVTKTQKMGGFNLAAKWKRKVGGTTPKEGWFILTNLDNLESAIAKR
jgi:hypothetical protein